MSHQTAIASFASTIETIRNEITTVEGQITTLECERNNVAAAPPHTDDIIAVYLRGLAESTRTFKTQLTAQLRTRYGRHEKYSNLDAPNNAKGSLQLLTLEKEPQQPGFGAGRQVTTELNIAALTCLLADRIEAMIPDLVRELFPEANAGMRQSDRDAALAKIDRELVELKQRKSQLVEDINAARRAVNGQG